MYTDKTFPGMFRAMLLLISAVIFASITAALAPLPEEGEVNTSRKKVENINFMLPKNIEPTHYELRLTPYLVEENSTFYGEIKIDINVLEPTNEIVLHAQNMTINESMTILNLTNSTSIRPKEHKYNKVFHSLTLSFESPLTPASYVLTLTFTGDIGTEPYGLYRSSHLNENGELVWVASTYLVPSYARRVFPCWDEPAFKARFTIIIQHYRNYAALSNMPMAGQILVEKEMVVTTFLPTPVMSAYAVSFVLLDYSYIYNTKDTIRIWTTIELTPYVRYALEIFENAQKAMEEYTKKPIGVSHVDRVIFPCHKNRVTSNRGLVIYPYNAITYNPGVDAISVKEDNILTMINEISHMWFGDLVSPIGWHYFWMSAGFATYFKYIIADKLFPDWRFLDIYGVREMSYIFEKDMPPTSPMNRDINNLDHLRIEYHPWVTYNKAGAILRMTAHVLSENVFHQGVTQYLETHANRSVTPDDFSQALQTALNKSNMPHDQFTVKEFLDTWENNAGYPLVTVYRDYNSSETHLSQTAFRPSGKIRGKFDIRAKWWIPITYATQTNPNFMQTLPTIWMNPKSDFTKIEGVRKNDWIILNVQVTGVYRVNYDEINWYRIAKCLNSHKYTDVHFINRANLINDAFGLLPTGRINPGTFFRLLCYLERESEPIPWEIGAKILGSIYPYIMIPEEKHVFRPRIQRFFNKIIDKIGFEEKPDEHHTISTLRPKIVKVACQYGHEACKKIATKNMASYMALLEEFKLMSEKDRWLTCVALREGGDAVWQRVSDMYTERKNESTLMYLSCTKNVTLFENFLEMMTEETSPISKNDFMDKVESILYLHPANIDLFFNYYWKNKNKLKNVIEIGDLFRLTKTRNRLARVTFNYHPDLQEDIEALASIRQQIDIWDHIVTEIRKWIENEDTMDERVLCL